MTDKTPWQILNEKVLAAARARDFETADARLTELQALTEERGENELRCNALFTEGIVRDAEERYADAENAFTGALALDVALHGENHGAVADTWNSIALVRRNAGNLEGALDAFRKAADIRRAVQPFALADALVRVGWALFRLGRYEDSLQAHEEALAVARTEEKTPVHAYAEAWLGAGEAHRVLKQFGLAFGSFATATQLASTKMAPKLQDLVARAWWSLGFVSRHTLKGCGPQAAVAFGYARDLGDDAIAERAEKELSGMTETEQALATPEAQGFRVVYSDPAKGIHHVAAAHRGLYIFRGPLDAAVGAPVEVELQGYEVTAIRPIES